MNTRFGYRWVYLVVGLAVYYQNHGEITLLDGSETGLSGVTVVPSWGIQANF
ncbi:hypothetical protein OAA91_01985 [Fibrobacterales bacterium]|nr:hypothetical protein [Fibrobacterales bacterium]